MLNAEEIRQSILQGHVPASWRIVRGSAWSAILFVFVLWIACVVVGTAIGFFLLLITALIIDIKLSNISIIIYFIENLLMLFLFLIVAYQQSRKAMDAIIVFAPEGCLEFLNISSDKPTKHRWQVLWYTRTTDLRLHVNTWNIWSNYFLNIQTHDGIHHRWVLNPYYGNRVDLAQDILIAYTTYTVLHRGTVNERTSE